MNRRERRARGKPIAVPPQTSQPNLRDLFATAMRHHQAGRLTDAERLYRQVLTVESRNADALHLLGVIAHQAGRHAAALDLIGQAIGFNPTSAPYHANLGLALKDSGQTEAAIGAFKTAIRLKPDHAEAHTNLGLALKELGRHDDAIAAFQTAIRIKPDFAEVHSNLGNALKERRRPDDALAVYNAAICLKPDLASAYYNRGTLLYDLGRSATALSALQAAIHLKPDYVEAHSNLGLALFDLRRLDKAIATYRVANCLNPNYADAYSNLGNVILDLGRHDEAVAVYRTAIRLKPDYAEAHYNLGNAYFELGRTEAARTAHTIAACLNPDYAEAFSNLGNDLKALERPAAAITAYQTAIRIKPDYAKAHFNEAIAHLLRGDFTRGWPEYEWRWRGGCETLTPVDYTQPQWDGAELGGRIILVHAEQGLGDNIQFCRYAALVAERGGRVVLGARRALLRLLSGLAGVERFVAAGDPLPDFDVYCPLLSLPRLFATTAENVPDPVPYLRAEEAVVDRWRDRLGRSGFKIGIAWQGNPEAPAERGRSAPLACFAPLAAVPGVRLISLQKVHGLDQLDRLPAGMRVETLGDDFDDGPDAFVDTAAVMMSLDLVVTVDTATGHLAGALGRPVWIALQADPHWVWMLEREDSPWYPSVRLFRQRERGNWDEVFARIAAALAERPDLSAISPNPQRLADAASRHHQAGRLAEAEGLYRRILSIDPRHAGAQHWLGVIAHQRGQNDRAVKRIGAAIAIDATVAAYHANLGIALYELGRLDDAVAACVMAILLAPDQADVLSNLGNVLMELGRHDQALVVYRKALRLHPHFAQAHANQGNALKELGQIRFSVASYRSAIAIRPDSADAYYNLSCALADDGKPDDALAASRVATRLKPDFAEARYNAGCAELTLGRPGDAILDFFAAARLKPDYAEAHYNSSIAHLLLGDLATGWRDYEWRWRGGIRGLVSRVFAQPQWGGEELGGRTVLLHAEQGMGDTIQFCRYASLVAERGGRVVLEAPRSMARLLTGLTGVDRLIAGGDPLPAFDLHCPLMSLPGLFGTTIERVPAPVPYLRAEAAAVARWRDRLGPSGFKIGIAWQGNPAAAAERGRSAPLACFAPLAAVPGVRLISLQKIHGLDQLDHCPSGMVVETLGADFDDGADAFVDTAAVMMSLDLVITVDTAIGHLAGALDRPVWLALQAVPHWVWMLERDDSPWYPSVRLFRQAERGQWDEVFRRMAAALPVVRSEPMD
jgi:tetratricopeptide (TPR) repeat protein